MDKKEFVSIYDKLKNKNMDIILRHIQNGVIFNSIDNVVIEDSVIIAKGVVIDDDNHLLGKTIIGEGAKIKSGNIIENSEIGSKVTIIKSVVRDAKIGANTTVGPFANIHTKSSVARDCRIGNFVEIKNSEIGIGTKMAHLAYIGDVDIGDKCNIGCGVIFVNYDGKNKHRSVVGNSVFVGSNSNVIAPVYIEDNAYIAAGTTVTKDLPKNCMCIGRNRETIKENRSKYCMADIKKKYFGTDGIRGVFGEELTLDIAYYVGNYLGYSADHGVIVLGRDTRVSGGDLLQKVISGILDTGSSVIDLGVTTTASVAIVLENVKANYGVMITASHNPPEYNGLKVFNSKGVKLTDIEEIEIEKHIDKKSPFIYENKGKVINANEYTNMYKNYLMQVGGNLSGLTVVLDCSNGSASKYAKEIFTCLGAECICVNDSLDGALINNNCGALHPDICKNLVLEHKADIGFSYDGDADRVIAIDGAGNIVDGDDIIYIIAKYLKAKDKLNKDTVVGTVMTNAGMENSLLELGIKTIRVDVGDHNVSEMMTRNNLAVGGESSGHIIINEFANTGDGILASLYLCRIVVECMTSLEKLNKCKKYNQVNISYKSKEKEKISNDEDIKNYILEQEALFNKKGRIIFRASGTEPKVRLTIEGEDEILAEQIKNNINDFILEKYSKVID